jgi:hypothetical protein
MTRFLIVAALVVMAGTTVFARGNNGHQRPDPAKVAELRTWFTTDVYPKLKAWHDEYDASLSAQDLAELNKLRAQAKQMMQTMRKEMKALYQQGADREEIQDRMFELREANHDAMYDLIKQVRPIVERSKDKLKQIYEANKDQIQAWREKVSDMRGSKGDAMMGMLEGGKKKAALRFILWDGTMPEPTANGAFGMEPGPTSVDGGTFAASHLTVAPNPSGSAARITLGNAGSAPVTIDVFDMNGVRVATHNATPSNGTLDTTIPTSGLASGSYMVSVNTTSGRRSTTLAVSR